MGLQNTLPICERMICTMAEVFLVMMCGRKGNRNNVAQNVCALLF